MLNGTMINSPVRKTVGKVVLNNGTTFSPIGALQSFVVERIGDSSKFFGYGIAQKVNVKLRDTTRAINISTANTMTLYLGTEEAEVIPFPPFKVSEVHRDENTNQLSITGYDAIYQAAEHNLSEITLTTYNIRGLAFACANLLGLGLEIDSAATVAFLTNYADGANFQGTETIREVLDAIAEATQTIYYINNEEYLVFKRLDKDGDALLTIDKEQYIKLDSKTNRRLTAIIHTTELGDNITAASGVSGSTQFVRENPFWELRDDIGTLLDNALSAVNGLTINQFECDWRGNYYLEIGDKIALITKDDEAVFSYLLDDTLTYDGTLSQNTRWSYSANDAETASNPSNLGDALKKTFARVDKANQEITLLVSATEANTAAISSLQINTDNINATVEKVQQITEEALDEVNNSIGTLTNKVEAQITAEDVTLSIQQAMDNGITKVETETGFTFNADGLTVSKSDSEISTQITEVGMKVSKNEEVVLTANNNGVDAINLHATTYLIIGDNSRFENYGSNRTGCFWIGGE